MRVIEVVNRSLVVAVAATMLAGVAPAVASAELADVVLYELAEYMQVVRGNSAPRRNAIAGLSGFAALGTPLCPSEEMVYENGLCFINAIGADSLDIATGKGPLSGQFAVVVQGDNPADGPEYGVMHGTFSGQMDLSTAETTGLGRMAGYMKRAGSSTKFQFTGVVRLPVVCGPNGEACYVTSGRDGVPTGVVPLDQLEYVLGAGTVRMDIWFK